jgi:hypothetical protein
MALRRSGLGVGQSWRQQSTLVGRHRAGPQGLDIDLGRQAVPELALVRGGESLGDVLERLRVRRIDDGRQLPALSPIRGVDPGLDNDVGLAATAQLRS